MPSSNKCSSALGHFFFVHCQETMDHNFRRQLKPCGHQHRWPKKEVKINNIFSNEVNNFCVFSVPIIRNFLTRSFAIVRSRSNISDWRVKPNIVKFILKSSTRHQRCLFGSGTHRRFQSLLLPNHRVDSKKYKQFLRNY